MLIEVMGPPGSGKTALAKSLVRDCPDGVVAGQTGRDRCIASAFSVPDGLFRSLPDQVQNRLASEVWDRHIKATCFKQAIEKNPAFAEALISTAEGISHETDYLPLYTQAVSKSWLFRKHAPTEVAIVNEGVCQYSATAQLSSDGARYVETMPLPDMIIRITAPAEICFERQENRPHGREPMISGMSRPEAIESIERHQELIDDAVDLLRDRSVVVSEIDGIQPPTDIGTDVLRSARAVWYTLPDVSPERVA